MTLKLLTYHLETTRVWWLIDRLGTQMTKNFTNFVFYFTYVHKEAMIFEKVS